MPEAIFLLQAPAAHITPTMEEMSRQGLSLATYYHSAGDAMRGWDKTTAEHPHDVIPVGRVRSSLFLAHRVLAPDLQVLCCFGYSQPANVVAVLVARMRGVRIVTRSDSNWAYERRRPRSRTFLKAQVLRLIFGRTARVWTVGTQNQRFWTHMGMHNQRLIPFGLPRTPIGSLEDRARFREQHQLGRGMVVLFVGSLEPWKGLDTLISSFRSLTDTDARLVVIGDGSLADWVDRASRVDDRLVHCGALSPNALGGAYAASDVLVLPSRRDAWGLVVDEAQANGLRVIVSDMVGAGTDTVRPDNGWVFRANDIEQLTATLRTAITQFAAHWPPPARTAPRDSAPEMMDDLVRLGVSNPRSPSGVNS